MDTDSYDQTVSHVMRQERLDFYAWPLQTEDRLFLFRQWIDRNSDAVEEIAIDAMGRRVSTKYLKCFMACRSTMQPDARTPTASTTRTRHCLPDGCSSGTRR